MKRWQPRARGPRDTASASAPATSPSCCAPTARPRLREGRAAAAAGRRRGASAAPRPPAPQAGRGGDRRCRAPPPLEAAVAEARREAEAPAPRPPRPRPRRRAEAPEARRGGRGEAEPRPPRPRRGQQPRLRPTTTPRRRDRRSRPRTRRPDGPEDSSRWPARRHHPRLEVELVLGEGVRAVPASRTSAIRDHIYGKLAHAGLSDIHIRKDKQKITIDIYTARPGIVIGKSRLRGGRAPQGASTAMTGKAVQININEIKRPELDAKLVAQSVAEQLAEPRLVPPRDEALAGLGHALGRAGREDPVRRPPRRHRDGAHRSSTREGRVPLHTLRADIDYGFLEAKTTFGRIGVKVWINKGEIMPEGYEGAGGQRRASARSTPAGAGNTSPRTPAPADRRRGGGRRWRRRWRRRGRGGRRRRRRPGRRPRRRRRPGRPAGRRRWRRRRLGRAQRRRPRCRRGSPAVARAADARRPRRRRAPWQRRPGGAGGGGGGGAQGSRRPRPQRQPTSRLAPAAAAPSRRTPRLRRRAEGGES